MLDALETAQTCARYADDKQAEDIVILDLRGISMIADYFVICTGTSMPHLKAIRREIAEKMKGEHEMKARSTEGGAESQWVVLDFIDVVVHIFHRDKRFLYALEDLWADAPRVTPEISTPNPPR